MARITCKQCSKEWPDRNAYLKSRGTCSLAECLCSKEDTKSLVHTETESVPSFYDDTKQCLFVDVPKVIVTTIIRPKK